MKILGIDPGLKTTGFGILEGEKLLKCGFIKGDKSNDSLTRIGYIADKIDKIIKKERPELCAMETLFFRKVSARSIILSAQLRGAILYILQKRKIPLIEYTPAKIKFGITGNGRASKTQINYMVSKLLRLERKLQDDEADALALAYIASKDLNA